MTKKKRGPKRIPSKWSRIIAVDEVDIEELQVWVINDDIEELDELKSSLIPRKKKEWSPLFVSKDFFNAGD